MGYDGIPSPTALLMFGLSVDVCTNGQSTIDYAPAQIAFNFIIEDDPLPSLTLVGLAVFCFREFLLVKIPMNWHIPGGPGCIDAASPSLWELKGELTLHFQHVN